MKQDAHTTVGVCLRSISLGSISWTLMYLIVHKAFFWLQADLASGISATAGTVLPSPPLLLSHNLLLSPQIHFRTYTFPWPGMLSHKIPVAHYQTMIYGGVFVRVLLIWTPTWDDITYLFASLPNPHHTCTEAWVQSSWIPSAVYHGAPSI